MELVRKSKKSYKNLTKEQKDKWFGESRNALRRLAYKKNKELRDELREKSLSNYRDKFGVSKSGLEEHAMTLDEAGASTYGRDRVVKAIGSNEAGHLVRSFTTEELVSVLGVGTRSRYEVMRSKGILPEAVNECVSDSNTESPTPKGVKLFTLDEVMAILPVLQSHFSKYCSLRSSHLVTISAIKSNIRKVRK